MLLYNQRTLAKQLGPKAAESSINFKLSFTKLQNYKINTVSYFV